MVRRFSGQLRRIPCHQLCRPLTRAQETSAEQLCDQNVTRVTIKPMPTLEEASASDRTQSALPDCGNLRKYSARQLHYHGGGGGLKRGRRIAVRNQTHQFARVPTPVL